MDDGKKPRCPQTCRADLPALACFAQVLAGQLRAGDVLLLYGSLGAGKTTFTQLVARNLGVGENDYVSSPSFALVHEYQGRLPVFHMDLYRLAGEDDVEASGLLEYFEVEGIVVVEWPERLGAFTPEDYLAIRLNRDNVENPILTLTAQGDSWLKRLKSLENLFLSFSADSTKQNGCACCS